MTKLSVSQILGKANSLLIKGKFLEAELLYAEVLMFFPNNVKAEQGLKNLRRVSATALAVTPPKQLTEKLISLVKEEKFEEAIKKVNHLLIHYPKASILWNIFGIASAKTAEYDQAIKAFNKLISYTPNEASLYYNLGNVFKDAGRIQEAVETYEKALELRPSYEKAFNNLTIALKSLDQVDETHIDTIESYQIQRISKAKIAEKYFNQGVKLHKQGKLDLAINAYKKSIKEWPDYPQAHYNMGVVFKDQGQVEEAIFSYNKAIASKPDYAEAYHNLGTALKERGKLEEALLAYHNALTFKPDSPAAYNNMGIVFKEQGKLEEAILAYRKALMIAQNYDEAVLNALMLGIELLSNPLFDNELSRILQNRSALLNNIPKIHILNAIQAFLFANASSVKDHLNQYIAADPTLVSKMSKKDKDFCEAYHFYLTKLSETHQDFPTNLSEKHLIFHFGESHCLSYANQKIDIEGVEYTITPKITFGGKAFHFSRSTPNGFKAVTKANFCSLPNNSKVLISFGEIDCRPNQGFLTAAKKLHTPIERLISNTAKGYISWFAKLNVQKHHDLQFFNVPAPVYNYDIAPELNDAVAEIIIKYNTALAKYIRRHDFNLIDVYSFTVGEDGYSNKRYHIDAFHLGPKAISQFASQLRL